MHSDDINSTRGYEVFANAEIERIVGLEVIAYKPTLVIGESLTHALTATVNYPIYSIRYTTKSQLTQN